jgi:hypothetical protein
MAQLGVEPSTLLQRHVCGDFGDMCDKDRAFNDAAVDQGLRIFSIYLLHQRGESAEDAAARDLKVWVITEADRSVTTLLLPEEY